MGVVRPAQWGITPKILAITLAVSVAVWLVLDYIQSQQLRKLFLEKEYQSLQMGAADDRRLFDQYAQAIFRSAKLIVGQKRFLDYVEDMKALEEAPDVALLHQAELPGWMPRSSLMRTFYRARYALLYDQKSFLRSAYHHSHAHEYADTIPQELLSSNSVLRKLSHNQAYMTMVGSTPYIIASERVRSGTGYVTLALVTPIDSAFLVAVTRVQNHQTVVALVDRDEQFVVASSDVEKIPEGALVGDLEGDFLVAGKSFFDYGASDLNLQLNSFSPTAEATKTTEALLAESNYQRAVLVLVMIVTFSLIMLLFVRRVLSVGKSVNYYSKHIFGRDISKQSSGDELTILGAQIDTLGNEVIALRNQLHSEAENARRMADDLAARTNSLSLTNHNLGKEIEERKRSEAERDLLHLQLQKAQRMDAIGQITGGVAHDFNNILASILGYADLAGIKLGKCDESGSLSRYLDQIKQSGERGRELVASMMAFSRGEAGERRVLALEKEIDGVLTMLRPTISSSIEIKTIVHDRELFVDIDPIKLQQIVMNLIVNARDGMAQGKGVIEVALAKVRIETGQCTSCHGELNGDYIELSVKDTGSGISPEILGNIFEPFFSTKEVGEGSGMGLSVIHGIMHANNGHILVESEPDEGTCFRLLFMPSTKMADEGQHSGVERQSALAAEGESGRRIMVVDDEIALTSFLEELLALEGYDVEVFNDPTAALHSLHKEPLAFDLIITDQMMPQLTGVELTEEVRKLNPHIPVIMCTGYSATTNEASARQSGVDEFMTKPVNTKQLLAVIASRLGEKQASH